MNASTKARIQLNKGSKIARHRAQVETNRAVTRSETKRKQEGTNEQMQKKLNTGNNVQTQEETKTTEKTDITVIDLTNTGNCVYKTMYYLARN